MKFSQCIRNQKGFSILSTVVAGIIIASSILIYFISESSASKTQVNFRDTFRAKMYAIELLELFRSFDNAAGLVTYLTKIHPGQLVAYNLCDRVNELNRDNLAKPRPDTVADLPPNPLDGEDAAFKTNRSYQIQVVNITTLEIISDSYCTQPASSLTTLAALPANSLFSITVIVSWIPKGMQITDEKRVEVSTLLPVLGTEI